MFWLAVLGALAAPEMIPEDDGSLIGRTAPPIEGTLLKGGDFDLAKHRGSVVVLSFWARLVQPLSQGAAGPVGAAEEAHRRQDVRGQRRPATGPGPSLPAACEVRSAVVWDNQAMALGGYQVMSMPTMSWSTATAP